MKEEGMGVVGKGGKLPTEGMVKTREVLGSQTLGVEEEKTYLAAREDDKALLFVEPMTKEKLLREIQINYDVSDFQENDIVIYEVKKTDLKFKLTLALEAESAS